MPRMDAPEYWATLERLVADCPLKLDRPKGSHHSRYPELVYPLDYGYLEGSTSVDGGGIDVWHGTADGSGIAGIVLTVDLHKRDAEIKILLDTSEAEIRTILEFQADLAPLLVRKPRTKD